MFTQKHFYRAHVCSAVPHVSRIGTEDCNVMDIVLSSQGYVESWPIERVQARHATLTVARSCELHMTSVPDAVGPPVLAAVLI